MNPLARIIDARNLTPHAVAHRAGVSVTHVTDLYAGRRPVAQMSLAIASRLAEVLGCSVSDLTTEPAGEGQPCSPS